MPRFQRIEQSLSSSDDMGHGPDIGSAEWHSVIEFKLGIRGDGGIPDHGTAGWCTFMENVLTSGDAWPGTGGKI